MDDERFDELIASFYKILKVAEVAAETYEAVENPARCGYEKSSDAVLEWFPKLRSALSEAGLLHSA
jgi:hypothetical protein